MKLKRATESLEWFMEIPVASDVHKMHMERKCIQNEMVHKNRQSFPYLNFISLVRSTYDRRSFFDPIVQK